MSVIIQPVDSFQLSGSPGPMMGNYGLGNQKFWLQYSTIPSWFTNLSEDELASISYRGFLKNATSMVAGQNLCDNLQVSGMITDGRNIPFLSYKPSTADPSVVIPYALVSGKEEPAAFIFKSNSVTKYRSGSYDSPDGEVINVVVVTTNNRYALFNYPNKKTGSWNSSYPKSITFGGIVCSPYGSAYPDDWYAAVAYCYDVCYQPYRESVIDSIIIPWIMKTLPTYPLNYTGAGVKTSKFESSVSKEVYLSNYLRKCGDWVTAMDAFTLVKLYDFGDLHYQSIAKIDTLSNNGIAYLKDIREILKAVKDYLSLLRGDASPKALASAYLGFKYGFSATYRDTLENFRLIKGRYGKTISGVSATAYDSRRGFPLKATSTIRYSPAQETYKSIYNTLMSLDLFPTAGNIWDFIPFSFVANWIVNIDECLDRIDLLDRISYYDVHSVFDTLTLTGSVPASTFGHGLIGDISFKRYTRQVTKDAFFPLIAPTVQPKLTSHWLEILTLMVQKLG